MLSESAKALGRFYKELRVPVRLIAGSDDRIVETDKHSLRLHRELSMSTFRSVPGSGHMVHHAAPEAVVAAIAEVGEVCRRGVTIKSATGAELVRRRWLHIGDSSVANESLAAA